MPLSCSAKLQPWDSCVSKRLSLREFQQNILDRIQQKEVAGDRITTLGIQVGQGFWLVEMQDISEVLPVPPLTAVPLTQPWYRGVANVRGNLYGIADLAAFMGQGDMPNAAQGRVILVAQKFAINVGFLVVRVLGLRDARSWEYEDREGEGYFKDEQGQMWRKLDVTQLLQQPDFLQIGI